MSYEYCAGVRPPRVSDTAMGLFPRVSVVHSKERYIKFEVYFIFQARIQKFGPISTRTSQDTKFLLTNETEMLEETQ
jgi:hypothetical protein